MPTIQRSIEVNAPITRLYVQLIQFEDYPRFLDEVESVRQSDIRHLHWTAKAKNMKQEGDIELTEQEENRHIAWHDAHDGNNKGRIDMEELGPNLSRMHVSLNIGSDAYTREDVEQRLDRALTNLKRFLERRGPQFDTTRMALDTANENSLDAQEQADSMNEVRQPSVCPTPENMSGSPTELLEDEPNESGVDALIRSNVHAGAPSPAADRRKH